MTNPPWHVTHDADGQYRDPVERWRQFSSIPKEDHVWSETSWDAVYQLMSDLAALCDELRYQLYGAKHGLGQNTWTIDNTIRKVMDSARKNDGSRRFPEVE